MQSNRTAGAKRGAAGQLQQEADDLLSSGGAEQDVGGRCAIIGCLRRGEDEGNDPCTLLVTAPADPTTQPLLELQP